MSTSFKSGKNWQPWVMPQVQGRPTPTTAGPAVGKNSGPAAATAEKLPAELLRRALQDIEKAKQQATEQGQKLGYEQGYERGHAAGLEAGLQAGREKGKAEGYAEGLAQAHTEIDAQRQALTTQFQQLLDTARHNLQSLDEQFGEQMIALSCALAKHIVQQEIDATRYDLIPLIQRAVRHTLDEQPMTLKLHPDDVALLAEDNRRQSHWQLQADEQIERGGFEIQAPWGQVDARLSTRWESMVKELLAQPVELHESD